MSIHTRRLFALKVATTGAFTNMLFLPLYRPFFVVSTRFSWFFFVHFLGPYIEQLHCNIHIIWYFDNNTTTTTHTHNRIHVHDISFNNVENCLLGHDVFVSHHIVLPRFELHWTRCECVCVCARSSIHVCHRQSAQCDSRGKRIVFVIVYVCVL